MNGKQKLHKQDYARRLQFTNFVNMLTEPALNNFMFRDEATELSLSKSKYLQKAIVFLGLHKEF